MKKVLIIILHFRNWGDTRECLRSLEKVQAPGYVKEVLVVDNGGVPAKAKVKSSNFIYLATKSNLGYAGGNNYGLKWGLNRGFDYFLLLNNDTLVKPGFLKELLKTLAVDDQIGIIGPTIRHLVENKTFYDYGGFIDKKLGKTYHENRQQKPTEPVIRDFVTGCCLLVKKEVMRQIGLLNEKYFLYLEDVEFCVRAQNAGWKIMINPKAEIFHKGSQSTSEWQKIKYSWRNSLLFSGQYIAWPWKGVALVYNFFFYPLLFIKWNLVRYKHRFDNKP